MARISFVLAATQSGPLIVNRFDYDPNSDEGVVGVGAQLLERGCYDADQIARIKALLSALRATRGDGVIAIDAGANIGVFSVEWGRHMTGWGSVLALEPQEIIYYALCGNIVLNNLFNVAALRVAVTDHNGVVHIPPVDYGKPRNFGGVGVIEGLPEGLSAVPCSCVTLDELVLPMPRVDLIKLDVEGMEIKALRGARRTIEKHHPIVVAEHIFCGSAAMAEHLPGYVPFYDRMNTLAIPAGDRLLDFEGGPLQHGWET